MTSIATKIASFGHDGEAVDRIDTEDCAEPRIAGVLAEEFHCLPFDLVTLPDQAPSFGEN